MLKTFYNRIKLKGFQLVIRRCENMSWSRGLLSSMIDPKLILINTPEAAVIKDKYPKAKHHFLVLPKQDIPSIFHLSRKHLPLLEELHLLALNAIELIGGEESNFKIGFHARPSMQRLHIHVISIDFNSSFLKTKKHWNSFNTKLFLPYQDVYSVLEEKDAINKLSKEIGDQLEKSPLKCNQCSYYPKTMPDLKAHLLKHIK